MINRGGDETVVVEDLYKKKVPVSSSIFLSLDVAEGSEDIVFGSTREMFAVHFEEPFEVKRRTGKEDLFDFGDDGVLKGVFNIEDGEDVLS